MNVTVLKAQINLAKQKTDQFISEIPEHKWTETPDIIQTNMNWQIGHIILANYLHGIASISGPNEEFRRMVDVKNLISFYGPKSNPTLSSETKPTHAKLIEIYEFTMSKISEIMDSMTDEDLPKHTEVPNPTVKTKYEALMWLSQHQSWHNGQIALLKRVLDL